MKGFFLLTLRLRFNDFDGDWFIAKDISRLPFHSLLPLYLSSMHLKSPHALVLFHESIGNNAAITTFSWRLILSICLIHYCIQFFIITMIKFLDESCRNCTYPSCRYSRYPFGCSCPTVLISWFVIDLRGSDHSPRFMIHLTQCLFRDGDMATDLLLIEVDLDVLVKSWFSPLDPLIDFITSISSHSQAQRIAALPRQIRCLFLRLPCGDKVLLHRYWM